MSADQRDGEQRREDQRQSLGPRQRAEHAAFLRFKQEYRQERDDNYDERIEQSRANLLRRANKDPAAFCSADLPGIIALCEMAIAVLHHDDGRIDEHADGQRQSAQRHDV